MTVAEKKDLMACLSSLNAEDTNSREAQQDDGALVLV